MNKNCVEEQTAVTRITRVPKPVKNKRNGMLLEAKNFKYS